MLTIQQQMNRMEYFSKTLEYIKLQPRDFPALENRKKRVLEELPLAPQAPPKPPTKEEMKALKKRDHQLLNALKIQLQPIMDQINRRYKKFRQPVIQQSQIEYLFREADPNYVRPDLAEASGDRPFEIVKDKHGNDVLMHAESGKYYYNLETTTIEERLSNGFYARPKDFLFDIKALARDAKNIGDKERTLKANELLSNVEVDVASIENSTAHIDWEALYQRQQQRAKEASEKERKRKAMQSVLERVQSDLGGGNDSDSQGPLTLGEPVPGARTMARFQIRSPLSNGHGEAGQDAAHPLSNGNFHSIKEGDVHMSGTDEDTQHLSQIQTSPMGPPPKSQETSASTSMALGGTQVSQRSVVTTLPPGVSPSAVINEASTTKTSDPSTNRSSNWSTQNTNGNHDDSRTGAHPEHDDTLPDTLLQSQSLLSSNEDIWPHTQARGPSLGESSSASLIERPSPHSQTHQSPAAIKSVVSLSSSHDASAEEPPSVRNSGSSASQPLSVEGAIEGLLIQVTDGTSGCTIEQLEQVNREMMDEIWRSRHEWNRMKVLGNLSTVFNDTIGDIENMQGMDPLSQRDDMGM